MALVYSATLRAVALTAMPAFDGARVASVAATREKKEPTMTAPAETTAPPAASAAPDFAAFTAGCPKRSARLLPRHSRSFPRRRAAR
ncbi:hypothetical protein DMP23_00025 [Amycolatopsis sp. A1MSW2902]